LIFLGKINSPIVVPIYIISENALSVRKRHRSLRGLLDIQLPAGLERTEA